MLKLILIKVNKDFLIFQNWKEHLWKQQKKEHLKK